jgi:hypothetical protein
MTSTIGTADGVHFDNIFSVDGVDPTTFDYPQLELVTVERHAGELEHTLQPVTTSPVRGRFWLNKTPSTPEEHERLTQLLMDFNRDPHASWLALLRVTLPQVRETYENLVETSRDPHDYEQLGAITRLELTLLG